MKIYLLHHSTYENTNVLFTDREVAISKRIEFSEKYNTLLSEWTIDIIEEGVIFEADFSDTDFPVL